MAKFFAAIARAISKIWGLFSTAFKISIIAAIALFGLLVFKPVETMNAIEFLKGVF